MFQKPKELFDEWLEGWEILYEEMEKGNIIFIPWVVPPFFLPVHKNLLSYLAKEFENFKTSASGLFNEWLDGWKAMDEMFDNPERFIGEAAKKFAENSINNTQQMSPSWSEGYKTRVFDLYDTPPETEEHSAASQPHPVQVAPQQQQQPKQ